MRYFLKTYNIKGKNKLQEKIINHLSDFNGMLICSEDAKDKLITHIKITIENFNAFFTNCKPCQVNVYGDNIHVSTIEGDNFFDAYIYKVTSVFNGFVQIKGGAEYD